MQIYLGADHAGFSLKQELQEWLVSEGHDVQDMGAYKLNPDDDYPDFAAAVGHVVAHNPKSLGVLLCGSAEGVCIAANKIKGIRAVTPGSIQSARLTRSHDNANVVCLAGGKTKTPVPEVAMSPEWAREILKVWLATTFSNEARHVRRLKKIEQLENNA